MTFLDGKRIKQLELHLPEFTRKVDPLELLPYLRCLTQSSREEIENRQRQNSKSQAAMKMYEHLIRMDDWWSQLLIALRQTNLQQLADKLEEIDEGGRPRVEQTHRKALLPKARLCRGDTKFKDLPARVSSILKILDSQEVENNWEAMAAHLNYSIEEVTRMKCNQNEASCTKKLFEDWSQREESTLHNLLIALHELERFDLLEQVQKVTGYRLPKIKKVSMDSDEHECDVILSKKRFNRKSKDTSLKEIVRPSNRKQDSTVFPGRLDPLTSDSETKADEVYSLPNKTVGPHNEPLRLPALERTLRFEEKVGIDGKVNGKEKLTLDCTRPFDERETVEEENSRKPDENSKNQSELRWPSEEGVDPVPASDYSNVDDNNYSTNKSNRNDKQWFNVNTSSHEKSLKDKAIDKLPLLGGISVLGIGAVMALVKLK